MDTLDTFQYHLAQEGHEYQLFDQAFTCIQRSHIWLHHQMVWWSVHAVGKITYKQESLIGQ